MIGLPRTPNDDLSVAEAMLSAASTSDGEIRRLYAAEAHSAFERARARLESLRIRRDALEAELLREDAEAGE